MAGALSLAGALSRDRYAQMLQFCATHSPNAVSSSPQMRLF